MIQSRIIDLKKDVSTFGKISQLDFIINIQNKHHFKAQITGFNLNSINYNSDQYFRSCDLIKMANHETLI